jgi:serine/threonine-protein kinase PpkA
MSFYRYSTLLLILQLSLGGLIYSQSFEDLKDDIQRRAAVIESFKQNGALIERADGLLSPSQGASAESLAAAHAENTERSKMFELIAGRTGTSVEAVARRFAEGVRRLSPQSAAHPPIGSKPPAASHSDDSPSASFVPVRPGSKLPLKVLTRPDSSIFHDSSQDSRLVSAEVPAFTAWIVLAVRDGWYQVAEDIGQPATGWMRAEDVMEWRHHMVVSFTHPGNRNRNLIFNQKAPLTDLMRLPRVGRQTKWDQWLDLASTGQAPEIAGLEPIGWLREKNQFYLLPILEQDSMIDGGRELMLLRIAAATRTRKGQSEEPIVTKKIALPMLDIVFVMDLTRSMGPFVETTLEMLRDIAGKVGDIPSNSGTVRFGLWGYRDDPKLCSGIEFNTRNYTPELQDLDSFLKTLGSVAETRIDSIDYAEDMFAGVRDAIRDTRWRDGSARTLMLVGDAPGRGPGETEPECQARHKPVGTASGMNASALRALADTNSVYLSAFYLEAPNWKKFTPLGMNHFRTLAVNPGSLTPDFKLLDARNPDDYAKAAFAYASRLAENLGSLAREGRLPGEQTTDPNEVSPEDAGRAMADNIFRNAFIEIHSSETQLEVPRDIDGWVADKDPNDTSRMTLEPGVLLTKNQLSSLRERVNDLLDAMLRVEIEGGDFFRQLQAVVTISGRDPSRLSEAVTLLESDYYPEFLEELPYKSKVMSMSRDDWREMGADRANQLSNEMLAKVRYYSEIYTDASKWQRLNANADAGDFVAPISIDMLP